MDDATLFYNMRVIEGSLFINAGVLLQLGQQAKGVSMEAFKAGDVEAASKMYERGDAIEAIAIQLVHSYEAMAKEVGLDSGDGA